MVVRSSRSSSHFWQVLVAPPFFKFNSILLLYCLSVVLIAVWGSTIYGHFTFLAGKAAPIEFQQLVIYKAMTFAEGIEKIDSCVVYHAGPVSSLFGDVCEMWD